MIRPLAVRLNPGEDLRRAIESHAARQNIGAGFILSCVGSLSHAALRLAGQSGETVFAGPLEILSLGGTLSPNGVHLHIALADAHGKAIGGHLLPGCIIFTTAELVIGILPDHRFSRRHDPQTGYQELEITTRRDDAEGVG